MRVSDRRFARRFNVGLPMSVQQWKSAAPEQTVCAHNVSERGVYFETASPPPIGATLKLRLEMPEEVTGVPPAQWQCVGTVVHAEPIAARPNSVGVGVRLDFDEACSTSASTENAGQ